MKNRARIAYYAMRDNVPALGWWLRRSLSVDHRRRLGLMLLRDEPLALRFEAGGFVWEVPVGDEITRALFANGEYSQRPVDRLHTMFGVGTLLEVGANVGTTTLLFAARGWDVIAVEPVPALHHSLAGNLERNGFAERVTLVEAAVAREKGRATMVVPVGAYGSSHVDGLGYIGGRGDTLEVDALTLDDLATDDVTLVWCDAEGSEGLVIEQGAGMWERGVPLYVEIERSHVGAAREHFESFMVAAEGDRRPIGELEVGDAPADVLLLP